MPATDVGEAVRGRGQVDSCPKPDTHHLALTSSGQELLLAERGLPSRNSTVSLTLFLKLVISSLISVILIFFFTVSERLTVLKTIFTHSMDMNLSKLWEIVKDREA